MQSYIIFTQPVFFPYFKKIRLNVRGRALGEIKGIIRFLEGWKNSLPPKTDLVGWFTCASLMSQTRESLGEKTSGAVFETGGPAPLLGRARNLYYL